MKRTFFQRFIAATVLIGAALGTASVAQARPDVHVSIGLPGLPPLPGLPRPFIRDEPVYVQPRPVYVQPRPVYVAPPAVVYERPSYRYEDERHREWRHREWQHRGWDRDGDGVPNRYDRRPDNPYRR